MIPDNFESLGKNKIEFVKRFAYDENLAKCLLSNDSNFKDYEIKEGEMDSLVWNSIFPCMKVIQIQDAIKSYITMKFKYGKIKSSNIYKAGYLTFFILCHKDIVQTDYEELRYDYILQCVNRLIFDTRNETWLGKMEFVDMDEIMDNSDYLGLWIKYKNVELL